MGCATSGTSSNAESCSDESSQSRDNLDGVLELAARRSPTRSRQINAADAGRGRGTLRTKARRERREDDPSNKTSCCSPLGTPPAIDLDFIDAPDHHRADRQLHETAQFQLPAVLQAGASEKSKRGRRTRDRTRRRATRRNSTDDDVSGGQRVSRHANGELRASPPQPPFVVPSDSSVTVRLPTPVDAVQLKARTLASLHASAASVVTTSSSSDGTSVSSGALGASETSSHSAALSEDPTGGLVVAAPNPLLREIRQMQFSVAISPHDDRNIEPMRALPFSAPH